MAKFEIVSATSKYGETVYALRRTRRFLFWQWVDYRSLYSDHYWKYTNEVETFCFSHDLNTVINVQKGNKNRQNEQVVEFTYLRNNKTGQMIKVGHE